MRKILCLKGDMRDVGFKGGFEVFEPDLTDFDRLIEG